MSRDNGHGHQIHHPKKLIFLEAFKKSGIIGVAARAASVHRQTHCDWIRNDSDFAAEFKHSIDEANDALLAEVLRRAVGNDASDTILIVLLKMRGLFNDRRELTGAGGGPIEMVMTEEDHGIATRIADSRLTEN